jgi:hypothetical protein
MSGWSSREVVRRRIQRRISVEEAVGRGKALGENDCPRPRKDVDLQRFQRRVVAVSDGDAQHAVGRAHRNIELDDPCTTDDATFAEEPEGAAVVRPLDRHRPIEPRVVVRTRTTSTGRRA